MSCFCLSWESRECTFHHLYTPGALTVGKGKTTVTLYGMRLFVSIDRIEVWEAGNDHFKFPIIANDALGQDKRNRKLYR